MARKDKRRPGGVAGLRGLTDGAKQQVEVCFEHFYLKCRAVSYNSLNFLDFHKRFL